MLMLREHAYQLCRQPGYLSPSCRKPLLRTVIAVDLPAFAQNVEVA